MLRVAYCTLLFLILCVSTAYADYYTIRVLDRSGRPFNAKKLEFTPDGQKLLLATGKGTMIIGVDGCNVLLEKPIVPFTVAFTRDNKQVLMASTKSTQLMHLDSGNIANIRWQLPAGTLGIRFNEEVGKLLIREVTADGPAEEAGIKTGDELIAMQEFGARYSFLGRSVEQANKVLKGPAGTRISLTILPRGKRNEKTLELTRRRGEVQGDQIRFLPERGPRVGAPCTVFSSDGYFICLDAKDGHVNSIIAPEESELKGLRTVSPDGKLLGTIGRRREKGATQSLIEIYDVATRRRLTSGPFDDSYYQVRFSNDSKSFLIGSHDSVYVFDVESGEFSQQLNMGWQPTLRTEASGEGEASDTGPTGWWFRETTGRTPQPLLSSFDLSSQGLLAIGSPKGEVTLWSAETGEQVREIAPANGREVEQIRISPDEEWIAYYSGGVFTLESVVDTEAEEPESEQQE